MSLSGAFPSTRMRRMRRDDFSRRLMQENRLTADDLIYPVFVLEGKGVSEPVGSMPGVFRHSLDRLLQVAEEAARLGVPALALFPVIDQALKTSGAQEAHNPDGLVPRVVKALKELVFENYGEMTLNINPDSIYTGALGGATFAWRAVMEEGKSAEARA